MTTPISPIGAITSLPALSGTNATPRTGAGAADSFATALGNGLDAVSGAQAHADGLAVQAATGELTDPATYTIAATEASLMTQLAATIESKSVAAFNTVMGMQA